MTGTFQKQLGDRDRQASATCDVQVRGMAVLALTLLVERSVIVAWKTAGSWHNRVGSSAAETSHCPKPLPRLWVRRAGDVGAVLRVPHHPFSGGGEGMILLNPPDEDKNRR